MKGWKVGVCTSPALLWELMEPLSTCSHTNSTKKDPMPILTLGCHDAEMQFVLLSAKITEGEQWLVCLFILTYFFSLLLPSFSPSLFPIAFSECNLVWWAGGLFWISQCFWLPPLACGAFSWSQSCRPGLEGWKRRRRRSSKSLGIGDLSALQSEPCRVQIERVILLLKLSVAPQMAFVRARDMFGDRVKATESFRLGESLGSAGKALWARQTEKAKRCGLGTFPPWIWTLERNKISGLEQREDILLSTPTCTHTYTEWD